MTKKNETYAGSVHERLTIYKEVFMLKKFFYIFILISIVLTTYANIINLTNAVSKDTNIELKSTEHISYFIPTNSENLFWPTPRIS